MQAVQVCIAASIVQEMAPLWQKVMKSKLQYMHLIDLIYLSNMIWTGDEFKHSSSSVSTSLVSNTTGRLQVFQ